MFRFKSITEYHNELKEDKTSCLKAVDHYLSRIREHQTLNAFTDVYELEARGKASQLDTKRKAGEPLKRLHGVVIAIKDVICYAGHKATASSRILEKYESIITSSALQFLIDEDAIIIGSCNCDEFAMGSTNENSANGPVLNALDHTKVPGGSSGGSAVAVQADLCMLSLGTDTGGSVRQPADFCGIIGLKPGYGKISRYGVIAYASSFDQVGIFGKNIDDIWLLLEIMSQPDDFDSTMLSINESTNNYMKPGSSIRFGIPRQVMEHASLDPEIGIAISALAEQLKEEGHVVNYFDLSLLDHIVPAYYVLTTAEASSNLSRYDGIRYGHSAGSRAIDPDQFYRINRTEGFGKEVKRRIMLGSFVLSAGYYDAYFSKAQKIRRLLSDSVSEVFNRNDAIIMPTVPSTALPLGVKSNDPIEMYLADIFTVFANLTGLPAISLPLFSHSNNMPFGLQVMTNRSDEVTLQYISKLLMQRSKREPVSIE